MISPGLKRRYLEAMGIDVWVPRGVAAGTAPAVAPVAGADEPAPAIAPYVSEEATAVPGPQDARTGLSFRIVSFSTPAVLVLGEEGERGDLELMTALARCFDPSGNVEQAGFVWPPGRAAATGSADAVRALETFAARRRQLAGAPLMVLLGRAADWLEGEQGGGVVRGPSAAALRADGDAKKQLWLTMQRCRANL